MLMRGRVSNSALGARFHAPEDRMTSAVIVHPTSVSTKGSRPATTPSVTGSLVRTAECAMGALPRPASEENSARFMPKMKAVPTPAPMKAPLASAGLKALWKISPNTAGMASMLATMTPRPQIT